ncbi:hypothetical protein P7M34_24910, partial [Vibrio parahaemolyticus]|nr:hypothetical protein [Vibrio parahaemolyticus]
TAQKYLNSQASRTQTLGAVSEEKQAVHGPQTSPHFRDCSLLMKGLFFTYEGTVLYLSGEEGGWLILFYLFILFQSPLC